MIRILPATRWARAKTLALALLLVVALAPLAISPAQAAATTFTVTNTNDSGPGSLRQAITDANANANPAEVDTITFNIPADDPNCAISGVCTISPSSLLPGITQAVSIDGYSQPGASPNTLATGSNAALKIQLNGAVISTGPGRGIDIRSPNSVVKGLIINRWSNEGVCICGADASGNRIEGNYFGTNASGTEVVALSNPGRGVTISGAPNNVVGGTSAAARNLISGNREGVGIFGSVQTPASGNRIEGNLIGTDASGTKDLGNDSGVQILSAPSIVVGGTSAAARNLISGNDRYGVQVISSAYDNRIEGNYIGTDASGTKALGNSIAGVFISDASNNVVGGTSAEARNIISGGNGNGVEVSSGASGNRIEGNYIGTDASGTAALGNTGGVEIKEAPNNVVGGTSAGARNLISGNRYGVQVWDSGATGNRILRNSIFDNLRLGIDLVGGDEDLNDVTPNDVADPDSGPNNLQNYPVITSATTYNAQTTIQGTLNSTPNEAFNLQFFSSPAADPSGFGEGKTYVGQTNVVANVGGNAAFSFTTNAPIGGGQVVTATATNSVTNDTSEFSEAIQVEDNTPPLPPAPQCSDGADNDMDGKIDFGGTNSDPGCASVTDDSESPDPPPSDTTAPTVMSTVPKEDATGVDRTTNVRATFSEDMMASSIEGTTFKLFKKGSTTKVAAQVSYDPNTRTATLNPFGSTTTRLARGTTYKAVITTGATDMAGNSLDENPTLDGLQQKTWFFTTTR